MSQKLISSSPMDRTRDGSWREPLKALLINEAACFFFLKMESGKDHLDEPREQCREEPGLCMPLACSALAGALLLARLPKPCLGSQCLLSHRCLPAPPAPCQCPAGHLARAWLRRGLRSAPCPPAIPWTKARKCHMPWLPLMHFSSSHRSELCQFSSFAVREGTQSRALEGGMQQQPPRKPSRAHCHPPAALTQAAGGQETSKLH